MSVVTHADQVTPAWLTRTLNAAGFSGTVWHVSWQRIGAGQVGENARFTLEADGDLPVTVVGKFPSSDPTSKQAGVDLNNYAREVFFYTTIAETIDTQTPVVYATEFDPDSHDFVILMEDLAPGVQIDQMAECSVDQAALALEQLARLHGPRWGDPQLAKYSLLDNSGTSTELPTIFKTVHPAFLERYGERLTAADRQIVARFGEVQPAYHAIEPDPTLIHIDYRVDNMIFGGPHPLSVIDWQSISLGCALNDASYFMGTSLSPERRATAEQDLLKHYLAVLNSYGVDLTWDECWRLYRRYAPAGLAMAVMASMLVGETERGNDMFMTMAVRSMAMCDDLESLKLLEG
jgi:hypothetical protein